MTPILKARWIADLRSGLFTQAESMLVSPTCDTHRCCLGVLIASARSVGVIPTHEYSWDGDEWHYWADGEELSKQGLDDFDMPRQVMIEAINRNDGNCQAKESFDQIANWLESTDF
jgi:hypothetical protein